MQPTVRVHRRTFLRPAELTGPQRVKVGLPVGHAAGDLIDIAVWNHYGTAGGGWGGPIPARPYLLQAMRKNRRKYQDALRTSAAKLVRGETTLTQVLTKLGILAQGDVKNEISSGDFAPNSPTTVAMKGSSTPLIDTGRLLNSQTWELEQ